MTNLFTHIDKCLLKGQGSFTRKDRTIFTLKIIVSIFVKLFLILVLLLRQFFIVRIFVKRATELLIILAIIQPNKNFPVLSVKF
jgi:ABC-type bacteriocin/lantibiotic exporter with double-glycine peptidase domain